MESFGTRLANVRKEHNLTQNDIADKLHISAQAVSKWENDITSPDIDTLIKLSEIYDMSMDELIGKEKTEPVYLPKEERKSIDSMMLKIVINSNAGDNIRLNLPMAAVKAFLNNDISVITGNKALEAIDFNQIYTLAEQGMMGELITMESADGNHIKISVE